MQPEQTRRATAPSDQTIDEHLTRAIVAAAREGQGKAIISVGGLDQDRIVSLAMNAGLTSAKNYLVTTVSDIVTRQRAGEHVGLNAHGRSGIILTGYSNGLSDEDERTVQGVVRQASNSSDKRDSLIVLVFSDGLPKVDVFSVNKWWYNGPFHDHKVHEITVRDSGVVLTSYAPFVKSLLGPREWREVSNRSSW
jgi:hypothetical protein